MPKRIIQIEIAVDEALFNGASITNALLQVKEMKVAKTLLLALLPVREVQVVSVTENTSLADEVHAVLTMNYGARVTSISVKRGTYKADLEVKLTREEEELLLTADKSSFNVNVYIDTIPATETEHAG